jgi:hypothetical protein
VPSKHKVAGSSPAGGTLYDCVLWIPRGECSMFPFSMSDGNSTIRRSVLAGLTLAMLLLAGCIPLPAPKALSPLAPSLDAKAGIPLMIVHSNDTWGYLTPCG